MSEDNSQPSREVNADVNEGQFQRLLIEDVTDDKVW